MLQGTGCAVTAADHATAEVTGLTADSRLVEPGFLFAALAGSRDDGLAYLDDALRRGAAFVLVARAAAQRARAALDGSGSRAALLVDDNPRRCLSLLAARFYGQQPETVAAVTGTNGKTSVVWFLRQIWAACGERAASLGTLGVLAPAMSREGSMTTPDPVALHATLAELAGQGVRCLAMEASSHGLDQHRLDGVRISAGGFTHFGRDHLDYPGSLDAYLAAKLRLFTAVVADGAAAVINADDPAYEQVLAAARGRGLRVLSYGHDGRELRICGLKPVDDGQRLDLEVLGRRVAVDLPLAGAFQASKALCAAGLAIATGSDPDTVIAALATLQPVRGRLERVARLRGASIYVDYAHTPDALAVVLTALRPQTRRRLVVVFGCGGDRDAGKRPEMGRIAAALADLAIVTDDNPRSENPADIRCAVLEACPGAWEIGDRADAIAAAIAGLADGDVLLVAGKGHETGQIVGGQVLPFDDAEVIRQITAPRNGGPGNARPDRGEAGR
jgi:UDP-N-acetylmuramoyl-L-alanyl-D-glutamate--2,6-diaminopimelate ligase